MRHKHKKGHMVASADSTHGSSPIVTHIQNVAERQFVLVGCSPVHHAHGHILIRRHRGAFHRIACARQKFVPLPKTRRSAARTAAVNETFVCVRLPSCVHVSVCVRVCMYVCMCVYVCVCVRVWGYTRTLLASLLSGRCTYA